MSDKPPIDVRICAGNRIIASLRRHPQKYAPDEQLCEFTAWFNADLSQREREIIILNYLNELLKGT